MAFDFAMAAFMLESFDDALEILSYAEETTSLLWFRMEILVRCRRFVELLNEISKMELAFAHEPETFFRDCLSARTGAVGFGTKTLRH